VSATMTASVEKIWAPEPGLGFLAHARFLSEQVASGAIAADKVAETQRLIFNDRLDAMVTLVFASLVIVILFESGRNWWLYATGKKRMVLSEARVELSRLTA
jgi:carbon starvation protein